MAAILPHVREGDAIRNPFNGETFVFTHVTEDPASARFDLLIEPGGMTTGTGRHHLHPFADEEFTVRHGWLRVSMAGRWHMLGPGETLRVSKGTPHLFRNGHAGETLVATRFVPGQQFLRFFLNMALSVTRHPEWYDARGEPPLALQALVLHAFHGHGYSADHPVWLQRAVFAALAPAARRKGYTLQVPPRPQ